MVSSFALIPPTLNIFPDGPRQDFSSGWDPLNIQLPFIKKSISDVSLLFLSDPFLFQYLVAAGLWTQYVLVFFLKKSRRRPVTKSKMTKELYKINAPPQAKVSLTYSTQSSKKILAKMASLILGPNHCPGGFQVRSRHILLFNLRH